MYENVVDQNLYYVNFYTYELSKSIYNDKCHRKIIHFALFFHLYEYNFTKKYFIHSKFLKKITMDANKMRPILDFTFILQKFVRSCCICRRSTWICMYRPDAFYSSITICSTLSNLGTLLNFCMTLPLVYSLYYCTHCRCFVSHEWIQNYIQLQ